MYDDDDAVYKSILEVTCAFTDAKSLLIAKIAFNKYINILKAFCFLLLTETSQMFTTGIQCYSVSP